jgi:hypothetical protein
MPSKYRRGNYETKISKVEFLLNILKKETPEDLAKIGISDDLVPAMENSLNQVKKLNEEQEGLKADLKAKTAELEPEMRVMSKLFIKAKKKIKAEIAPELWKKYGFEDKT